MGFTLQKGFIKGQSALLAVVFGVVALAAGLLVGNISMTDEQPATSTASTELDPHIPGGLMYPTPRDLTPFSLTDYDGNTFTQDAFRTHWTVIFPGYTFCPDICPVTLTVLNQVKEQLSKENLADDVQVVFLSVDPDRDSPERLREYTQYFNPQFIGVTGNDDALKSFTTQLGMIFVAIKEDGQTTDYLVDHSASLAVINPNGQLHAVFQPEHNPDTIASSIALLKDRWKTQANSQSGS